jgi:hypothetical protein
MRKIKTILMIMVLGMLFISCEEYNKDPIVREEVLSQLDEADTLQYLVVTDEFNNITYFRINEGRTVPTPEVKLLDKMVAVPIIFSVIGVILIFLAGFSIGKEG